jgi:hypothetical protein
MIYLKTYEGIFDFLKKKPKETDPKKIEIINLCRLYNIRNYTINDDYSIDVDDNVDLSSKGLEKIPLKFNKVTGYFNCMANSLTNLENAPKWVDRNFMCQHQYNGSFTSLKGAPEHVGFRFDCHNNPNLISLEGLPSFIGATLEMNHTGIYSFDYFHESIDSVILNDTPLSKITRCFLTNQEIRTHKIIYENIDLFKSCDPIHPSVDGARPILYMSRFLQFLEEIGRTRIAKVFRAFYNNEKVYSDEPKFHMILDAYEDIKKHYFIV